MKVSLLFPFFPKKTSSDYYTVIFILLTYLEGLKCSKLELEMEMSIQTDNSIVGK